MLEAFQKILNPIFSAISSSLSASENVDVQFFAAIASKDVGKVKKIIQKDPSVLEWKNSKGNNSNFFSHTIGKLRDC